jgi:hypothetical protein
MLSCENERSGAQQGVQGSPAWLREWIFLSFENEISSCFKYNHPLILIAGVVIMTIIIVIIIIIVITIIIIIIITII